MTRIVNQSLPQFHQLLDQLVSLPSVSSAIPSVDMSNRPVVEQLANWLEALGFDVAIKEVISSPGKVNLVARRRAKKGAIEGGLLFSGHTDTVPWDENRWSSDPFKVVEKENRLYGLGATDMKGFFPVLIETLRNIDLDAVTAPITVVATADEESSMSGARSLLEEGVKLADFAIIGEPTNLIPIRMHKGIMMESIHIQGQSGHSSDPSLGKNALEVMHDVITELREYRKSLQRKYQHNGFTIPVPTLNLGCIHGGDNPNRICGSCELQFDLRPVPGMEADTLRAEIKRRLEKIEDRTTAKISLSSLFPGIDPFEQPENSILVSAAETFSENRSDSVAYATEAPFFQKLGIETIVLGAGSIDQAHQPDEYLPLNQIKPATKLYTQFIRRFCG